MVANTGHSASDHHSTRGKIGAIIAASSGNLVEWFDFYVYSFCSIYFAGAFFPRRIAPRNC